MVISPMIRARFLLNSHRTNSLRAMIQHAAEPANSQQIPCVLRSMAALHSSLLRELRREVHREFAATFAHLEMQMTTLCGY